MALTLDNGIYRYDHLLMATGYRIEVIKVALLGPSLRGWIAGNGGLPLPPGGIELGVPDPRFVGAWPGRTGGFR